MEQYKKDFIDFIFDRGALKICDGPFNGYYKLKSGRLSPIFFNAGGLCFGSDLVRLGLAYASVITKFYKNEDYDLIFGPSYKGITLAAAASCALFTNFKFDKLFSYDRKEAKTHGESSKSGTAFNQKDFIVGAPITPFAKILLVDDVLTTGATKIDTINLLNKCAENIKFQGLIITIDREETLSDNSKLSAKEEFEKQTSIKVHSIVTMSEIISHLYSTKKINQKQFEILIQYQLKYGNK